ncbi:MAG: CoA transferase [Anaerolineae bacterium]|nr:CoA transferase [Anaerolineae bacterium]NIN96867.1 CoA transferase [Anaerolineae bacterium]NIQ79846.1 CoA transferase [Anaerolineae bacterium]
MKDLFADLTVLSMEQATVLPYLTYRLAAEGMRVIRVEHPERGDPNRLVGSNVLGEEAMDSYFLPNNVGKKAITLNVGGEEGQAVLRDLILKLRVDIFASNQLPRNYAKLGIDYEQLKAIKEDIIWVGITGFGPESNEAAYDPILQARCGFMDLTGEPDGPPQVFGLPMADLGASEHAYGQIMGALYKRQATGEGSRIDISMFQSAVSWQVNPVLLTKSFGAEITRRGNTHEFFAPVSVYESKDGYVYIAVGNDRQWQAITELPGFESLYKEERKVNAGRIADVKQLNEEINEITRTKTTTALIELFNSIRVPISTVKTIKEVIEDPLVKDRLISSRDPHTGTEVFLPPTPVITPYLESVDMQLSFPPRMGEHNDEIYGELLGYGAEKVEELKEGGVI